MRNIAIISANYYENPSENRKLNLIWCHREIALPNYYGKIKQLLIYYIIYTIHAALKQELFLQ